jgi:hypothetical protein
LYPRHDCLADRFRERLRRAQGFRIGFHPAPTQTGSFPAMLAGSSCSPSRPVTGMGFLNLRGRAGTSRPLTATVPLASALASAIDNFDQANEYLLGTAQTCSRGDMLPPGHPKPNPEEMTQVWA